MDYLKILLIHNDKDMPNALYSELDNNRYEIRQVAVFPNTKIFQASKREYAKISLSNLPIPSIEEIEKYSTDKIIVKAEVITKKEFEEIWSKSEILEEDKSVTVKNVNNLNKIKNLLKKIMKLPTK